MAERPTEAFAKVGEIIPKLSFRKALGWLLGDEKGGGETITHIEIQVRACSLGLGMQVGTLCQVQIT